MTDGRSVPGRSSETSSSPRDLGTRSSSLIPDPSALSQPQVDNVSDPRGLGRGHTPRPQFPSVYSDPPPIKPLLSLQGGGPGMRRWTWPHPPHPHSGRLGRGARSSVSFTFLLPL